MNLTGKPPTTVRGIRSELSEEHYKVPGWLEASVNDTLVEDYSVDELSAEEKLFIKAQWALGADARGRQRGLRIFKNLPSVLAAAIGIVLSIIVIFQNLPKDTWGLVSAGAGVALTIVFLMSRVVAFFGDVLGPASTIQVNEMVGRILMRRLDAGQV